MTNKQLDSVYDDASHSPGLALWHVTNRWQRAMRAALSPFGLTHVQFVLLAMLVSMDASDPISQRELATRTDIDVMMTSQVIRTLEQKSLVERQQNPADRRAVVLIPTKQGIELVNQANSAVEAADHEFFGPLGESVPRFTRDLNALRKP